jgi:hypothetical protein
MTELNSKLLEELSKKDKWIAPQQFEFAPLFPPFAGSWIIGDSWHINVIKKPTEEQIKNTELWFGWKWKDA